MKIARSVVMALAVLTLMAGCGEDPRKAAVEEFLTLNSGGLMKKGELDCVADEILDRASSDQIDTLVNFDPNDMSMSTISDTPLVMSILAAAGQACE